MHGLRRLVRSWVAAGLIGMLACGCAARRTLVVLVPDHDGRVGKAQVTSAGGRQMLDEAGQAAVVRNRRLAPEKIAALPEATIQALFADALAAEPPDAEKHLLYFNSGTTQLNRESLALLSEILAGIHRRQSRDISINGHTDRVGSAAFNQDLPLQRALAIQALLVKAGIDPRCLTTSSHGEGNPVIQTADHVAEPRNRRVEVVIR